MAYAVRAGIPRFVEDADTYAASFGLQWNQFRSTQLDSAHGGRLSAERFFAETGWTPEWLAGKVVLDAGCGAGRFLEIAAGAGAKVVGLDVSSAVDAARANLSGRADVSFVQASIFDLPFRAAAFDACYCIGVLQHTPDPPRALASLTSVLKPDGRLAVTAYERKRWTMLNGKYLVRPLTKRLHARVLLRLITWTMPLLFGITEVLFRIPKVGRVFRFLLPVANYTDNPRLSTRERYEWAVLDTFDMLSPEYDQPLTERDVRATLAAGGMREVARLPNAGLNVVAVKS